MRLAHAITKLARVLPLFMATIFVAQAVGSAAPARADYCYQPAEWYWQCNYAGEGVPRWTKRWFQAATTKRSWTWNEVADPYGGSVNKCAGHKRASDGAISYLICSNTAITIGAEVPSGSRPGWVFVEQRADGPRIIYGGGHHPNWCC